MFSKEAIQQMQQAAAITAAVQAIDSAMDQTAIALPADFKLYDFEPYMTLRRRIHGPERRQ